MPNRLVGAVPSSLSAFELGQYRQVRIRDNHQWEEKGIVDSHNEIKPWVSQENTKFDKE